MTMQLGSKHRKYYFHHHQAQDRHSVLSGRCAQLIYMKHFLFILILTLLLGCDNKRAIAVHDGNVFALLVGPEGVLYRYWLPMI